MVRKVKAGLKLKNKPCSFTIEEDLIREFENRILDDPEDKNNNKNRKIRELIIRYLGVENKYPIHRE